MIKTAKFIVSSSDVSQCPATAEREYAFIGRSNVGKSTLINCLCNNQKLAKASSTPGKTLLINHFLINNEWYIVDLPGYGYATASKTQRERLRTMIERYMLYREQLTNVFVLIDIRHEPQKIDVEFMQWLGENGIPFSIIFTKADKLSRTAAKRNIDAYMNVMEETWEELPPYFITSATEGTGKDEVIEYIEKINKDLTE